MVHVSPVKWQHEFVHRIFPWFIPAVFLEVRGFLLSGFAFRPDFLRMRG